MTKNTYLCGLVFGAITVITAVWACFYALHIAPLWAYVPIIVSFAGMGLAGFGLAAINLECFREKFDQERRNTP